MGQEKSSSSDKRCLLTTDPFSPIGQHFERLCAEVGFTLFWAKGQPAPRNSQNLPLILGCGFNGMFTTFVGAAIFVNDDLVVIFNI